VVLEALRRMNETLRHRGPDGEGYYLNTEPPFAVHDGESSFPDQTLGDARPAASTANVGLGHRRLAIIDLRTGDQPLSNEDGSVWAVFNGEIYNFQELREALQRRGHRFRTRSDTEVIVHGWEEWGEAAAEKFRGMFAIGLWDEKRRLLWLARDRLGKKPLYYALDSDRLVFASELKAIRKLGDIACELDPQALDAYLSFGYVPSPMSIFKQVRKLEPAQWAVCTEDDFKVRTYWRLEMKDAITDRPEEDLVAELTERFDEAVRLRLMSDVPLGAFLSGGVDSSAVVASMALQQPQARVKTTSIGFSERRYDELAYARRGADRYGTDHREFVVSPDALEVLHRIVWHLDEPFADASAIPTWYVSQMARREVTVALSGDGGDETFAGYAQRYRMCRLEDRIRKALPAWTRTGVLAPLSRWYPRFDGWPRPLRLKRFLANVSRSFEEAFCRDMAFYFKPEEKEALYLPEFRKLVGPERAEATLLRHVADCPSADPVTRAQYVDLKTYLPEDILVKVDRMSMAHSLEVRAPILDHHIVEWAGGLASRYKLNGVESKAIFKKMNARRLPAEILYRKKHGFVVPLAQWLRGDLRGLVEETLFSEDSAIGELFQHDTVRGLWTAHQSGRFDNATPLWGLMMFALWRRTEV
jgi:asparagine synthase (glutamine-hydrolysing)